MSKFTYAERKQVYEKALAKCGEKLQSTVAIEEMSEVIKEITKMQRGELNREHMAEEIADATIMLEQMRYFFGLNDIVCWKMDEKIKRLDDNLAPEVDLARGCIVNPLFKTNGDMIRAMTDEELAELLWQCCCDCGYEGCWIHDKGVSCLNCCESAFLDWLRQEVKTNS